MTSSAVSGSTVKQAYATSTHQPVLPSDFMARTNAPQVARSKMKRDARIATIAVSVPTKARSAAALRAVSLGGGTNSGTAV